MIAEPEGFVAPHNVWMRLAEFDWQKGPPIGNGRMGGLVYQPGQCLEWSLNRLEVSQCWNYRREPAEPTVHLRPDDQGRPLDHARMTALMEAGEWTELDRLCGHPFVWHDRESENPAPPPWSFNPVAGWLRLHLRRDKGELEDYGDFQALLDLFRGEVRQTVPGPAGPLTITSAVLREPEIWSITLAGAGLSDVVESLELARPAVDGGFPEVVARAEAGPRSGRLTVTAERPGNGFRYAVAVAVSGGEWRAVDGEGSARLELLLAGEMVTVTVSVQTVLDAADPLAEAVRQVEAGVDLQSHRDRWREFWSRSAIDTGDDFLDGLWYVGLYALAASNADGHHYLDQACGMSGLWQATDTLRWSNSWVLDVNIQEAYSPCFATNHVELAEPFARGVEARAPLARAVAETFFGLDGLSFSSPGYYGWYYHCSGPWYCLYLWLRYRHNQDRGYLARIYPILRDTTRFFEQYLAERDGRLQIWPDNSPENASRRCGVVSGFGMTTHNAAIDLALVKHQLRATAYAAAALGVDEERRAGWLATADRVTDYHVVPSPYGPVIADSESDCPPEEVELRHASRLMAIWPCCEISLDSDPAWQEIGRATVRDTAVRTEIVPHTFGWVAAAAARLGMGDFARQHLLERGAEPMLLPNGTFAEQTSRGFSELGVDRLVQPSQPLLEGGSTTAAAICEMLLHSHDGRIRLFPAAPSTMADARFHQLRAECGFLVSAERAGGEVRWAVIEPELPGMCRVINPWPDGEAVVTEGGREVVRGAGELVFEALPVRRYLVHRADRDAPVPGPGVARRRPEPSVRQWPTRDGMHVAIGADPDSLFRESVESFVGRTWNGNQRQSRHVPYRFQLGRLSADRTEELKRWLPAAHRWLMVEHSFATITPATVYHPNRLYGWTEADGLEVFAHDGPDPLRREGLGGLTASRLRIDLTEGLYGLMLILGDASRPTCPAVEVVGHGRWSAPRPLAAGRWTTPVVPVRLERDGAVEVVLSSGDGERPWACCGLLVRWL